MKYLFVVSLFFLISCADDLKKKSSYDLPDQGIDSEIDSSPDQPSDVPDVPVDAPDVPIDTPDVPPDVPIEPSFGPIKVTTWNILCLRENSDPAYCNTDSFGNEFVRSPQQVLALGQHANAIGTDLLFLQEVESRAAVQNLLPGWQVFDVGNGGQNVALAVAPGSPVTVRDVSTLAELDLGYSQLRPGLVARIEHGGILVHILAVHLKSGCQVGYLGSNDSDCNVLRDQLAVLQDWVRERVAQNQPFMMVGDFNRTLEYNDPFMQALDEAAGQPLTRSTVGARPSCWDHLPGAPSYASFIDHHIVSPAVVAAWGTPVLNIYNYSETYPYAWEYVSDHCAITASFD